MVNCIDKQLKSIVIILEGNETDLNIIMLVKITAIVAPQLIMVEGEEDGIMVHHMEGQVVMAVEDLISQVNHHTLHTLVTCHNILYKGTWMPFSKI